MDRKAMSRAYKETARPMGVFCVRNSVNGKAFVGSSTDLPAMLNRQRAQLGFGGHPNRELQREWREMGEQAFAFEVLDSLEPRDEPGYDPAAELKALEALWLEKLAPYGERGYNVRPKE